MYLYDHLSSLTHLHLEKGAHLTEYLTQYTLHQVSPNLSGSAGTLARTDVFSQSNPSLPDQHRGIQKPLTVEIFTQ
jgi:hypothetical protein